MGAGWVDGLAAVLVGEKAREFLEIIFRELRFEEWFPGIMVGLLHIEILQRATWFTKYPIFITLMLSVLTEGEICLDLARLKK